MTLDPTRAYTLPEIVADGEPQFFPSDPLHYKALLVTEFERLTRRKLYEGQVEMYMVEVMSYALAIRSSELQYAVVQRLLPFAFGRYLDLLTSRVNTFRLKATSAGLTARFTLVAPRPATVVIPAGTRVRGDGADTLFLTDGPLLIQAGSMSGDIHCSAEIAGTGGNGIRPDAALTILDPVTGVASCAAVTASSGGANEETDVSLRVRASEAWETISRGGPRQGYAQLARSAHPAIIDVAVVRPQPCEIQIFPLTTTMPPGDEVLAAIAAACEPYSARPEGDELFVLAPTAVTASVILNLVVDGDPAVIVPQAEAAVHAVFAVWRQSLGVRLSTAVIVSAVQRIADIVEVTVDGLTYRDLADDEFVVLVSLATNVELA